MNRYLLYYWSIFPVLITNHAKWFCLTCFQFPNIRVSKVLIIALILSYGSSSLAQQKIKVDTAYSKIFLDRSAKIVNTLGIKDSLFYKKIQRRIAQQYMHLNAIHDKSKLAVAEIKSRNLSAQLLEEELKLEEEKKKEKLSDVHAKFIIHLNDQLTDEQVEKVKDGMTYRVLPVTWAAYMDMLQNLTLEQKNQMYDWLVEARELAMDEGSSEDKHKVFGKYKGKINNYLSAAGYDMKKEGEEWSKRMKAEQAARRSQ